MAWSKDHIGIWSKRAKRQQTQKRQEYRIKQDKKSEERALSWRRIEAILGELESLDRQTGGIYRDTYDWEPLSIVNRLLLRGKKHGKRPAVLHKGTGRSDRRP